MFSVNSTFRHLIIKPMLELDLGRKDPKVIQS
uniref:Uncharacterized protein n=1 Tax=Phlebotomus papatasi TaxID=29031 RepID=A0A1B0EY39_PHLPP